MRDPPQIEQKIAACTAAAEAGTAHRSLTYLPPGWAPQSEFDAPQLGGAAVVLPVRAAKHGCGGGRIE